MSASASLDKDLLDTLTEEERAAFDDADDAEIESLRNQSGAVKDDIETAAGGKADDDEGDDGDDDDGAAEAAAADGDKPDAAPAPASAAAPAAAAPAEPAAAPAPAPQPVAFQFELPADYEDRLAANKTARDSLDAKLKDGEITLEEMQVESSKLDDERRELDGMRIQHDIALQSQRQMAELTRQAAINRLFDSAVKPDGGGIDYRTDQAKMRDLDTFVRALAADEANADKSLDWFLAEGHRRVRALHGIASAAPAQSPAPAPSPAAAKAAAAAARKAPIEDLPKTLAHVPGGDGPGDVGGEFDDILGLEGEAYERAIESLAKTNPARFARFQAAQQ